LDKDLSSVIKSGASAMSRDWTHRDEAIMLMRLGDMLSRDIVMDKEGVLGIRMGYTNEGRPIIKSSRGTHSRSWDDLTIINLRGLYETFTASF
jgi:hypothetical protein